MASRIKENIENFAYHAEMTIPIPIYTDSPIPARGSGIQDDYPHPSLPYDELDPGWLITNTQDGTFHPEEFGHIGTSIRVQHAATVMSNPDERTTRMFDAATGLCLTSEPGSKNVKDPASHLLALVKGAVAYLPRSFPVAAHSTSS
ncbi:hypothetical protein FKW77_008366 [Venturia effusa]|uniref:Uncharacterized protein n=1 Tax=Venturia effusa TaxID=50376 RepID=A0A517LCP0_9PEZI|nr:hypothetical protein FKW77_008366 [Venturia effusa]